MITPGVNRPDLVFGSTKVWRAVSSTAFRQWRATSHCGRVHGYELQFGVAFEADTLDLCNWVVDFGSLKSFKGWLEFMFDHTTLVASDDPEIDVYHAAHARGVVNLREVDHVGCEMIAYMVFVRLEKWLVENGHDPRVRLMRVDVREHDFNSAYVRRR